MAGISPNQAIAELQLFKILEKNSWSMRPEIEPSERAEHVKYEIRDIIARAKKVEATGKKIHYLNIGDPNKYDFIPPKHVTEAIIAALREPKYSGYAPSQGDPELIEAIAKMEGVPGSEVFVTSGLSEGIDMLFQALINPGDNMLLPSPNYPLYATKSRVSGGEDNLYKCGNGWVPDTDDIRKKINQKTRAIVVINPNNPTGAVYPEKVLREIVGIAGEHNLPLIADEIYDRMTLDEDAKMVNLRKLTKDVPLVSGNGISKNFLYPGARVGYLAFHGQGLGKIRDTIMKLCNARLSVNWEMQRGALAAFTMPDSHLAEAKKKLRERRDITYRMLNEIDGIRCEKPKAAFYAFPEVTSPKFKHDKEFCYSLLEKTGVLVVPGSSFSSELGGKFFRLVYLPKPDELKEAIGKIDEFVKSA